MFRRVLGGRRHDIRLVRRLMGRSGIRIRLSGRTMGRRRRFLRILEIRIRLLHCGMGLVRIPVSGIRCLVRCLVLLVRIKIR